MSAPAAPPRPRLLQRPVSPAQREAARRNGARSRGPRTAAGKAHSSLNARRHGLYATLHLFNTEEAQSFRAELQDLFERLDPRDPADVALVSEFALATFQFRRALDLNPQSLAPKPRDISSIVGTVVAIGAFESRYTRLLYRSIPGIENLEKRAAESIVVNANSEERTAELIEDKENAPVSEANFSPRLAPRYKRGFRTSFSYASGRRLATGHRPRPA